MANKAANKVAGGIADLTIKISDTMIHHMGPKHYGEQLQDPIKGPTQPRRLPLLPSLRPQGCMTRWSRLPGLFLSPSGQASGDVVGHR